MEEPAAAWVPCDLQLANWTMEPAECSPSLPAVDYAASEIFGNSIQTSVPVSKGEQVVEYGVATMYDSVATAEHQYVVDLHDMEKIIGNPGHLFKEVADEFKVDMDMMGKKIHRYPASIQSLRLSERYTVPMVVAIGPYHHGRDHLKHTEKVKHVAAYNCIRNSGNLVQILQKMYDAIVAKAHYVRSLYDKDVMENIHDDDFLPMMFYDACFLVQYMLIMSGSSGSDASSCKFFEANDNEIYHDIMLLENQLPWPVVQTVMEFVPVPLKEFINSLKGCLQDRKDSVQETSLSNYEPPHLLALLRFNIVGENKTENDWQPKSNSISFSVNAIELAEIGITLKPSGKTELIHMGLKTKGTLFAELSLAPLSLDSARASWLINMAALELCTTSNFHDRDTKDEESAVCSYLLLLAMMVDREADVQELRTKRLLQGGGGLTNSEALEFFTSIQGLRLGSCYVRTMEAIENYRVRRRTRTSVHAFFYKNFKIIAAVLSAIVTIVSILGTHISQELIYNIMRFLNSVLALISLVSQIMFAV